MTEKQIYQYEKYVVDDLNNLKDTIDQYGVAIVKDVLNGEEINRMNIGMWNFLGDITGNFDTPITRDNPQSWKSYSKLMPKHSMLLQHFGIGHAQYIWDIRQNVNVCKPFSKLWNVEPEELLVSFDGASFHFPHEILKRGYFRNNTWLHVDQRFAYNEFDCVQGWVTGYDVRDGDATLTFLEGSHKFHGEFAERFNMKEHKDFKKDWYKLENQAQHDFFMKEKNCLKYCIKCPAGSMMLWDSRTIHSGQEPEKERAEKNFRNIAYVCMTPRSRSTEAFLKKKIKAFNELRMTTHWPHKPKLFPKNPQTYGQPLPNTVPINPPVLSDLGRKLAGF